MASPATFILLISSRDYFLFAGVIRNTYEANRIRKASPEMGMRLELNVLANRFDELVRKPNKTKEEIQEKEEIRIALEAAYVADEKPLVDDLLKADIDVTSSWDLVDTTSSYKAAIPILIKHLSRSYHVKNKEGIVRASAVKEARGVACRAIIDEYRKTPKENFHYCWAFGNTMAIMITEDYIDDVIAIV